MKINFTSHMSPRIPRLSVYLSACQGSRSAVAHGRRAMASVTPANTCKSFIPALDFSDKIYSDDSQRFTANTTRCHEILHEKMKNLGELKSLVKITFTDHGVHSCAPIWIDARSGSARLVAPGRAGASEAPSGTPDVELTLKPENMVQVYQSFCSPPMAILKGGMSGPTAPKGNLLKAFQFMNQISPAPTKPPCPGSSYQASELPKPTTDMEQVKRDIGKWGYGIVKDALSTQQVDILKKALFEQAAGERAAGVASYDGGPNKPNQRIWNLFNKGDEFLDLLNHPLLEELLPWALGDNPLLWIYAANIARPGGVAQPVHMDQEAMGNTRAMALAMNVSFNLVDTTTENGATLLIPASHQGNVAPVNMFSLDGTISAEVPAGSALIYESRLWHATGPFMGKEGSRPVIEGVFSRSWVRPKENASLLIKKEVEDKLAERHRALLGLRTGLGGVGGPPDESREGVIVRTQDMVHLPGRMRAPAST